MSFTLFKRNMMMSLKLMVIFIAIMAMYNSIVIYMYNPELSDMIKGFQEAMPQMMSAVGMMGVQDTLLQFIQTYLYGFIMMIFPMIYSIILIQKMIVKYVDSGSMACLLATPNSRKKIIVTQLLSSVISMFFIIAVTTMIGLLCSGVMFPDQLDIKNYILLNVALMIFHVTLNAIVFLAACLFQETKYFYIVGAGLPIVFFLIDRLKDMGDKLEFFKYFTIFSLFPDEEIVNGKADWVIGCLILIGISIVLHGIGVRVFCKKDLPL